MMMMIDLRAIKRHPCEEMQTKIGNFPAHYSDSISIRFSARSRLVALKDWRPRRVVVVDVIVVVVVVAVVVVVVMVVLVVVVMVVLVVVVVIAIVVVAVVAAD